MTFLKTDFTLINQVNSVAIKHTKTLAVKGEAQVLLKFDGVLDSISNILATCAGIYKGLFPVTDKTDNFL